MYQHIFNTGQSLILPRSWISNFKPAPEVTGGCMTGSPRGVKQVAQVKFIWGNFVFENLSQMASTFKFDWELRDQNKMFRLMCISYSSLCWPLCHKASWGASLCEFFFSNPYTKLLQVPFYASLSSQSLPLAVQESTVTGPWKGTGWSHLSLNSRWNGIINPKQERFLNAPGFCVWKI